MSPMFYVRSDNETNNISSSCHLLNEPQEELLQFRTSRRVTKNRNMSQCDHQICADTTGRIADYVTGCHSDCSFDSALGEKMSVETAKSFVTIN